MSYQHLESEFSNAAKGLSELLITHPDRASKGDVSFFRMIGSIVFTYEFLRWFLLPLLFSWVIGGVVFAMLWTGKIPGDVGTFEVIDIVMGFFIAWLMADMIEYAKSHFIKGIEVMELMNSNLRFMIRGVKEFFRRQNMVTAGSSYPLDSTSWRDDPAFVTKRFGDVTPIYKDLCTLVSAWPMLVVHLMRPQEKGGRVHLVRDAIKHHMSSEVQDRKESRPMGHANDVAKKIKTGKHKMKIDFDHLGRTEICSLQQAEEMMWYLLDILTADNRSDAFAFGSQQMMQDLHRAYSKTEIDDSENVPRVMSGPMRVLLYVFFAYVPIPLWANFGEYGAIGFGVITLTFEWYFFLSEHLDNPVSSMHRLKDPEAKIEMRIIEHMSRVHQVVHGYRSKEMSVSMSYIKRGIGGGIDL